MTRLRPGAMLPIAGAFTLLAALAVVYFPGRSYRSHLEALQAKAVALAEVTAHNVAPALDFDDTDLIDECLEGMARDTDVSYLAVYRDDGALVRSLDRTQVTWKEPPVHLQDTQVQHEQGWVHVAVPIAQQSGAAGVLVAAFNTRRVERAHAGAQRAALWIGFAIFALGVLVSIWNGAVMRNVERLADENRKARQDAEKANRAKTEFLAKMSHELRTPLNGILGMIDVLLRTDLADGQRRSAEVVMRSGQHLLSIVNDVLDLSKIEAGRLELHPVVLDLRKLTARVVENAAVLARDKNLEINCKVTDDVPPRVLGDGLRIEQVLLNLFSNAVKFTERGSVSLRATCVARRPESVRIRFEVRDTGVGIAPETRGRLFEAFNQGDGSITRRFGGTGLGLAISKQLVTLMCGAIGVDSEPGKGSRFHFEIDLEVVSPDRASASLHPPAPLYGAQLPRRLRALAAEDNSANREVLASMLEYLGCEVVMVETGRAAVDTLREGHDYDLVLMDCQMPVMDGLEAARLIRERESANGGRAIPIVAVTAHALEEERIAVLAAGMQAFLTKPITVDALRAVLTRLFPELAAARSESTERLSVPERSTTATAREDAQSAAALDEGVLRELERLQTPRNPRLLANLVERFVGDGTDRIIALRTAARALNAQELSRLAHGFLGWSATIGAVEVASLCRAIEDACEAGATSSVEPLIERLATAHARAVEALRQRSEGPQRTEHVRG